MGRAGFAGGQRTALAGFLLAAALAEPGSAFVAAAQAQVPDRITVSVSLPPEVTINRMPPIPERLPVNLPVTVAITNRTQATEMLHANDPCAVHHWEVADAAGQVVDREKDEVCTQQIQARVLDPGETLRAERSLTLDGKALRDGESYTLHYRFWGFAAEGRFRARVVH
jgi:hypothetical protein